MRIPLVGGVLLGAGGVGVLGTGGYLAWRSQQPSDVKSRLVWEGLSVANNASLGVYKAIYLASSGKDGFSSFVTAGTKEQAAPLWKSKCDELLRVKVSSDKYEMSLEEAKKWCLVPEKETIEISLLLEDANFSSTDDDYKNTFALNKNNQIFMDVIKGEASVETLDVNSGFSKVRDWCSGIIKKSPREQELKNVKAWCIKPDSNLNSFMDRQGFKPVDEGGWDSKFTSLNSPNTDSALSADIGTGSETNGAKLKTWCGSKNLGTAQIHSLAVDLEKIKNRCFVRK